MIVKPKDAATVILIRPCPDDSRGRFEILMVLRHPKNKFVASSYVFPGGALDKSDCDTSLEPFCTALDRNRAGSIMRDMPQRSLGAWIAGIRETFEEAGILLAYDRSGSPVALREADEIARFHNYRRLLYGNSITLKTILEREELALATDSIYYYSHWITPESSPIRYDVRFFVAPVPSHQAALHDGHELIDHVWVTPQEALLANRAGNFRMVLPTIMTLKELCCFGSVEEVIRSTRDKKIPAILTTLIRKGDRLVEIMPDGTDFGPSPVADQEEG